MLSTLKWLGIISVVATVLGLFFEPVTELPLGIDEALTFFVGTITGLISVMPWLEIVWQILLLGLSIKILLFTWHWIKYIIDLFR